MESSEWPKAMMMATSAICGQTVPLSQPRRFVAEMQVARHRQRAEAARCRCSSSVMGHQIRNTTTITVVICMMRSALPLDS